MTTEKRKHSRIGSMNLLNYIDFDENGEQGGQGMGRTLNVSESGIQLETHLPIPVAHTVSLTIGFKEDVVDIKGRVIYTKKNAQGMFESGIEFFEMDQNAGRTLKNYIAAFHMHAQEGL